MGLTFDKVSVTPRSSRSAVRVIADVTSFVTRSADPRRREIAFRGWRSQVVAIPESGGLAASLRERMR